METIKLTATTRKISGKKVKKLRKQGLLPAILYGQGKSAQNLTINLSELKKTYLKAGTSALIDLIVDDQKPIKALLYEPQLDPVSDEPVHIDIYKIKMDEKITTEIPLNFVGEAPAVKELEGNLIINKNHVEVECLPADLVSEIKVDISCLKTFDDSILLENLQIPENIKVLDNFEDNIALVTPPRSEEELKAIEETPVAEAEKAGIEKMEAAAATEKAEKVIEKEGESKKDEKSSLIEKNVKSSNDK